jgi:hypothetical protein
MSSRLNSVKADKKSFPTSLFLVLFVAHWADVGVWQRFILFGTTRIFRQIALRGSTNILTKIYAKPFKVTGLAVFLTLNNPY